MTKEKIIYNLENYKKGGYMSFYPEEMGSDGWKVKGLVGINLAEDYTRRLTSSINTDIVLIYGSIKEQQISCLENADLVWFSGKDKGLYEKIEKHFKKDIIVIFDDRSAFPSQHRPDIDPVWLDFNFSKKGGITVCVIAWYMYGNSYLSEYDCKLGNVLGQLSKLLVIANPEDTTNVVVMREWYELFG